jgi:hypothetical protein
MGTYPPNDDPTNYSLMDELLSCKRNLVVLDREGNKISNGTSVDKRHAMNAIYNGSASLGKEAATLRQSLVGTTFVECALSDFQYTPLLLSKYTEVLYDFVHSLNLEFCWFAVCVRAA